MSSHAQDATTQKAASTGAQTNDATLDANAAQNQQFANQARTTLFGTYDPTTNAYVGGTESAYLNPAAQNTTNLTGSYANEYGNMRNQNAQTAQNSVGAVNQNLAAHGMGASPAGFAADQQRKAYQDQATNNGNAYAGLFGQQHNEAVSNFQNANNMLNSNSTGASSLSLQGNSAAAGNYGGLYGQASQQVQSPLSSILGATATLGAAGIGKIPCWVAAEIFGGWYEPRTVLVRAWLFGPFAKGKHGKWLAEMYLLHGERTARAIRRWPVLKLVFAPLMHAALHCAKRHPESMYAEAI